MQAERIYDGASWLTIADQTYVNTAAPTGTLNTGDLWYDTDEVSTIVLPWSVANGGTGATTAAAARTSLAMPGEELAYNQVTTPVTINATAEGASNVVVEGTSRTYDGNPVMIEFNCYGHRSLRDGVFERWADESPDLRPSPHHADRRHPQLPDRGLCASRQRRCLRRRRRCPRRMEPDVRASHPRMRSRPWAH
jgi:hypothetical protein